jgi:glycerol-3-phosphate cytidylyltransferase
MTKKIVVGYTTGVFDLFHIGHLNILKNARSLCDYLIVGVTTDEITVKMKGKSPLVPFIERYRIVEAIKYVDKVVPKATTHNKDVWDEFKFDVMIKGDDWNGTEKGRLLEEELSQIGVLVKYLPYTKDTSSTILRDAISKLH